MMIQTRTVLFGIALVLFAAVDATAAEPRRILLLHAFGHAHSPWSDAAGSFRSELIRTSPEPIDIYEVALDTTRVQASGDDRPFVEYFHTLLSGRKLDLIVPVGAPAAFFMQRNRSLMFPTTPMMVIAAEARRIPRTALTENDAAVLWVVDHTAYIENIFRIRPQTTTIAVITGNSPVERYWSSELRREYQRFAGRATFEWFNELTLAEIRDRAARMPPESAIFLYLLSEDAAGVPYTQDRALELVREVSAVPIFGIGDYQVGRGVVGGPVSQTQTLGRQAAQVALRILKGEPPASIGPILVDFGAPMYDWRELRRWDISEALLPPGSIVQFREPSIWERYRWQFLLIALAGIIQSLLIVGLLYQRRRRRSAELEARRRMEELAHVNRSATIGEMSASIAHEINQPLAGIVMNVGSALRFIGSEPPQLEGTRTVLNMILRDGNRASQVISTIRAMFKREVQEKALIQLNEPVREVLALLRSELDERKVSVNVVLTEGLPPLLGNRIQLQQVILNLVRNASEAMGAMTDRARILRIRSEADVSGSVILTVTDTGPGIDAKTLDQIFEPFFTTKPDGMGMGLSICRSIIEAHGGRLSAEPAKPNGMTFRIVLPRYEASDEH